VVLFASPGISRTIIVFDQPIFDYPRAPYSSRMEISIARESSRFEVQKRGGCARQSREERNVIATANERENPRDRIVAVSRSLSFLYSDVLFRCSLGEIRVSQRISRVRILPRARRGDGPKPLKEKNVAILALVSTKSERNCIS